RPPDICRQTSVGKLEGGHEPLVALERAAGAEGVAASVVTEIRVPVAQIERPFLEEGERHAGIPVQILAVALAAGRTRGCGSLVRLEAQQGAEGRREHTHLWQGLGEGSLDGPGLPRLVLVFRRVEDGHTQGAVLPNLRAAADLELEVVRVVALRK